MKYCVKCGMLLEDTHERCIKCGTDVTQPGNFSLYPPEVKASMEREQAENKKRSKMIATLIALFVVLIVLIGLVVWKLASGSLTMPTPPAQETVSETVDDNVAAATETEEAVVIETESEEVAPVDDRDVKDDAGSYFKCTPQYDAAGNLVFNAVYPEDLTKVESVVDIEKYSDQYPELISFVASDEENTIRFTYMSPQQLWYKESEVGKTRKNERDPQYYMTFYTYESARAYIDELVNQSYKGAKKIECTAETEAPAAITEKVQALSDERKKRFKASGLEDFAHLGEDTVYAALDASCSAMMYDYQITDKNKDIMCCRFFVPVISNTLMYATDSTGDRGKITEWYILGVTGIEAGSEDMFDDYSAAFEVFASNCYPTREFFYTCSCYQDVIKKAITDMEDPKPLDADMLKSYGTKYNATSPIGDFNEKIYDIITSYGSQSFASESIGIRLPDTYKVAFYDKDAGRMFFSPDETEYPGSTYEELLSK